MSDISVKICDVIKQSVNEAFSLEVEDQMVMVERPRDPKMGDYSTNIAMRLAKSLHKKPVDIANELGFKKSSVSIAMKKLRQENHITVTDAGFIYLTDSGKEIANMIYERHEFISKWLIELGVPEEIATDDACQMEHVISKESFNAIKEYVRTH